MRKHDQGSAAAARDRKGRFSARRKRATVLRLLRGEDLESVSRELGITAARASQWRDQFLAAGQAGLKSRAPDARDEEHQRLHAKVGELLMENELLYAKVDHLEAGSPFGPAEVDAMKGAQSIPTRRAYGVQRICRVWGRARSSVYARRHATRGARITAPRAGRCRPGRGGREIDAQHPEDRCQAPISNKPDATIASDLTNPLVHRQPPFRRRSETCGPGRGGACTGYPPTDGG